MKALDLKGRRFGRLQVIERAGSYKNPSGGASALWRCLCDCGKELVTTSNRLVGEQTQSCGCKHREIVTARMKVLGKKSGNESPSFKHGQSNNRTKKGSSSYISWQAMKQRCLDPNAEKYPNYGATGVTVSERWLGENGFTNFLADLGKRLPGTTLGRFGDVGNYEPGNCRWMTPAEQRQNWRPDRNMSTYQKVAA
jgi:hypothetical protein